jgi:hypothetical protein
MANRTKDDIARDIQSKISGTNVKRNTESNTRFASNVAGDISSVVNTLIVDSEVKFTDEQNKVFKDMAKILQKIAGSDRETSRERKQLRDMFAKLIVKTEKEIEALKKDKENLQKQISQKDVEITGEKEEIAYRREEILEITVDIERLEEEKKISQEEAKRMRSEVDEQIAVTDMREEELKKKQVEIEKLIEREKFVVETLKKQTEVKKVAEEKFPASNKKRESAIDFLLGTTGIKEKTLDIVRGFLPGFDVDKKVGSLFDKVDEKITGNKFGQLLTPYLELGGKGRNELSKEQLIERERLKETISESTRVPLSTTVKASEPKTKQTKPEKGERVFLDDPLDVYGGKRVGSGGLREIFTDMVTPQPETYQPKVESSPTRKIFSDLQTSGGISSSGNNDKLLGETKIHTSLLSEIRDNLKQQTAIQKEQDREKDSDQSIVSNDEIRGKTAPAETSEVSKVVASQGNVQNQENVNAGGGGFGLGDLPGLRGRGIGRMLGKTKMGKTFGRMLGRGKIGKLGRSVLSRGVGKTASKTVGKAVAKGLGKSLLKKIPLVGAVVGAGLGISRLLKGDIAGAGGEVLSGLAGTVPGIGTAASVGIDAALAAKDASNETSYNTEENVVPTSPTLAPKMGGGLGKMALSAAGGLGKMALKATPLGLAMAAGGGITSLLSKLKDKSETPTPNSTVMPAPVTIPVPAGGGSGPQAASGNTPVRIQDNSFIRYQDKRVARV